MGLRTDLHAACSMLHITEFNVCATCATEGKIQRVLYTMGGPGTEAGASVLHA